ncbi:alpha-amylase family glycosyl hydrolase [Fodinicola feengrottensis]|uniref:Alpha-amylase family glycosyl hydrolase n=1 Tax=Fodinicola feengrottensis TaxID=435914 RepID=A0ABN2I8K5_9ACTN
MPTNSVPISADHASQPSDWWREAVFYQVYVRSFFDANGDGVGDLDGIRGKLDHLVALGVDALWLTPFFTSPMVDHGYDVADPRDVDPLFGDLAAFDRLLAAAHEVGIKVTIDVVPNHTSSQHPWFVEALAAAKGSPARARYHFMDGYGLDGAEPPNNWPSIFGGPAWTRVTEADGKPGQWYLHIFAPEQPDLNWANPEVGADLARTLRFWLDRGVDGFRIDVAHGLTKPAGLPDMRVENVALLHSADDDPRFDNDGVHEIHRMIRSVVDEYPDRMTVGEVWVRDNDRLRKYVRPDELHLAFNFRLTEARWRADELTDAIEQSLETVAGTGTPTCWVWSNHDIVRHLTRFGDGLVGERRARAAVLLQLALPGVAYLYNGDELGMPSVDIPDEALTDPTWERSSHTERGRDNCRIPLPWTAGEPPYGFSPAGTPTWLPMPAGWAPLAADTQRTDPSSMFSLYRTAVQLRGKHPGMAGDLEWVPAPAGCVAFRRTGGLACVLNVTNNPVRLPAGLPSEVLLTSVPLIDGLLPGDAAIWLC